MNQVVRPTKAPSALGWRAAYLASRGLQPLQIAGRILLPDPQCRSAAGRPRDAIKARRKMSQDPTALQVTGVFSGLTEQGNINLALATLLSLNSGGSAPSSPTQFQFWADTSVSGQVAVRQYIGTSWVPIWIADTGTGLVTLASSSPQNWAVASGTHDAITVTYDPPVAALVDGLMLSFRASAANLTATPTFTPHSGVIAAKTIVKSGVPLVPGDIRGSSFEAILRYNATADNWSLLNPPYVPVGGIVPYFGGTIPTDFILPQGQILSSAQFPAASAVLGTTYGNPGGGNFAMPDLRGRLFAALDAGGSNRITAAGGNFDGTVLGNTGGAQSKNIAQNQLPNVSPSIAATFTGTQSNYPLFGTGGVAVRVNDVSGTSSPGFGLQNPNGAAFDGGAFAQGTPVRTVAGTVAINGGVTQQQLATLPPMMMINCMMRIA